MPKDDSPQLDLPRGHSALETQISGAPGDLRDAPEARSAAKPKFRSPRATYAPLVIHAEALDRLQDLRTAIRSRIDAYEREEGGRATAVHLGTLLDLLEQIKGFEGAAERNLERVMRGLPLGPWQRDPRQRGIGEKQLGRLLAVIGDPYIKPPEIDRETKGVLEDARPRRGPAELWAYCGLHTVDGARPRRRTGQQANWNSIAKSRAILIAERCLMAGGHYAEVYYAARAVAATKVHDRQCQNTKRPTPAGLAKGTYKPNGCGTRDHPEWGAPGTPWRPGHQHQHALSMVAKEILKDLWIEGRRLALEADEEMADAA